MTTCSMSKPSLPASVGFSAGLFPRQRLGKRRKLPRKAALRMKATLVPPQTKAPHQRQLSWKQALEEDILDQLGWWRLAGRFI